MSENSLKNYNSFGLDVKAEKIIEIRTPEQLHQVEHLSECLILGGGSNVLFTKDFEGTVLINKISGIAEEMQGDDVVLHVGAGEVWHDLVMFAVSKAYGGIENLSLIPGSVGAAPMQNIGAYGVEVENVLEYVEAYDLKSRSIQTFSKEECQLGYRESVFKRKLKGLYFITKVGLRLKRSGHKINSSYGAISEVLNNKGISNPSIKDISDAVIHIRRSKLPDPKEIGNAGSFFKNPVIPVGQFNALKEQFPEIRSYPVNDNEIKVPAGWLIDSLGWKGKRFDDAGVHSAQALVLVNHGKAQGKEIYELSQKILEDVEKVYGITLEREVNIL